MRRQADPTRPASDHRGPPDVSGLVDGVLLEAWIDEQARRYAIRPPDPGRGRNRQSPTATAGVVVAMLVRRQLMASAGEADECGNGREIERWLRRRVDRMCAPLPTSRHATLVPRLSDEPPDPPSDVARRRWNALLGVHLDKQGIDTRRGIVAAEPRYRAKPTHGGWVVLEDGPELSAVDESRSLTDAAAAALYGTAQDVPAAAGSVDPIALAAKLREDADRYEAMGDKPQPQDAEPAS